MSMAKTIHFNMANVITIFKNKKGQNHLPLLNKKTFLIYNALISKIRNKFNSC